jgi:putative transposase
MPRAARVLIGDICYHAINRGNAHARVFHDDGDYQNFVNLLAGACERIAMRVLAYCLMPNHFHLVVQPWSDGDLSRWMHWLLTSHVRRHHRRYETDGRVWQGRFKALPIQADDHLLTVMRYVERNPLRGGLVTRAEAWRWSSLRRSGKQASFVADAPVQLPKDWLGFVNSPESQTELAELRRAVKADRPFGDATWGTAIAKDLGLRFTPGRRGRPSRIA